MQQTAENRNRWRDRENGTIIIGLDQWEHDKNRSKADAVNITVVTFSTRKTFNKRDSSLFGYDPERSSFRFSIWKTSLLSLPASPPPFLSKLRSSRGFPSDEDECNAVQRDVNSFPVQDVWSSDNGPFPFSPVFRGYQRPKLHTRDTPLESSILTGVGGPR